MPVCPVCAGTAFGILVDSKRLHEECRIREEFVARRLLRPADSNELKDLTNFFHTADADLLVCEACRLLLRAEHEPPTNRDYSQDEYDMAVIERQYPQYVEAFRKKKDPYRNLLARDARVLEIGSHYGAFLQVAGEWGWKAEGVDPGKDPSRYAQARGFTVHVAALEDCAFAAEQFDAVFIWNCFEQIVDPKPTLAACHRILKRDGLLTVRTPDGQFYALCEQRLCDQNVQCGAKDFLLRALGYNNLLGFPYLYGHSGATLKLLIQKYGFRLQGTLSSELLTFPLPEKPPWVEREEREISAELRLFENSVLIDHSRNSHGPWIEAWFRAI